MAVTHAGTLGRCTCHKGGAYVKNLVHSRHAHPVSYGHFAASLPPAHTDKVRAAAKMEEHWTGQRYDAHVLRLQDGAVDPGRDVAVGVGGWPHVFAAWHLRRTHPVDLL